MKILEAQSATLSNPEVLAHITAFRARPRTPTSKSQNFETVIKELFTYLLPPASSLSPIAPYDNQKLYNKAAIRALITQLKQHRLMKSELLMILNLRPQDLGLLDCVVEECDLRFTEQQQEQILGIIAGVLGSAESMDIDDTEAMNGNGSEKEEGTQ